MGSSIKMKYLTTALSLVSLLCVETACEDPLLLTPYLQNNDIQTARRLSTVDGDQVFDHITIPLSYAGFLTVNETLGSHVFFWFFPARNVTDDPLLLWLNGGPLTSSMLGVLWEHGPVRCKSYTGQDLKENEFSWINFASVLYVDNPIGAGYSFSESGSDGERFKQEDITRELYSFLEQFFVMFSEYKTREFYVGGQSYAGKYVPHLAHFIHQKKANNETDLPLTGVYLGGPLFDPLTQLPESTDYLYSVGVVSYATYSAYKAGQRDFIESFDNGPTNLSLQDITHRFPKPHGVRSLDNYFYQGYPGYDCVNDVMRSLPVRHAVHAGTRQEYQVISSNYGRFGDEFFLSSKVHLAELMGRYKVLVYTGDFDAMVSSSMTEAALLTTPWPLQLQYNNTVRSVWDQNDWRVLGYFSVTGEFCRVVVRGAGHQTPYDQPETSSLMMSMFIRDGCVHN